MKFAVLILTATLSSPSLAMSGQTEISLKGMEPKSLKVKLTREAHLSELYQRVVAITQPQLNRKIASKK